MTRWGSRRRGTVDRSDGDLGLDLGAVGETTTKVVPVEESVLTRPTGGRGGLARGPGVKKMNLLVPLRREKGKRNCRGGRRIESIVTPNQSTRIIPSRETLNHCGPIVS
jgi:hypothetical protein